MKKRMKLIIAILLGTMLLYGCSKNETSPEDFEYELKDGTAIITGYIGTERDIHIPAEIEDRPVTEIGSNAFETYDMFSITLPDSVTRIGSYAFTDCNCLEEISIPETVTVIEVGAFYHCDSLRKVDLPPRLERIGDGAFNSCVVLSEINIPRALEYIGSYTFGYCDALLSSRGKGLPTRIQTDTFPYGEEGPSYSTYVEYVYENGVLIEQTSVSTNSTETLSVHSKVDENGNIVVQQYFSSDGTITQEEIFEYSEYGKTVTMYNYSTQGRIVQEYNEKEELLGVYYYAGDQLKWSETYQYSEWGLESKIYESSNGSIYFFSKVECNEYGEIIRTVAYEKDGELNSITEYAYDNQGNVILEESFRVEDGLPGEISGRSTLEYGQSNTD